MKNLKKKKVKTGKKAIAATSNGPSLDIGSDSPWTVPYDRPLVPSIFLSFLETALHTPLPSFSPALAFPCTIVCGLLGIFRLYRLFDVQMTGERAGWCPFPFIPYIAGSLFHFVSEGMSRCT